MWIWINFIKFWRAMIEGHGDDLYKYRNIVANFSSNVYNEVVHTPLWNHLRERMECMVSYPEPQPYTLEGALAAACGVAGENVCVTNGATEAIYLIAQCFAGEKSVIFVPTFSEYADACRVHRHTIVECTSLQGIREDCRRKAPALVWICNPNNPTGRVVEKGELKKLTEEFPEVIFVFDQSYAFFTDREVMTVAEGVECKNIIQLHSMTKRYAVPGIRLGYLTACAELLQRIRDIRMPWSVNAFAIETGLFLLQNDISESTNISVLLARSRALGEKIAAFGTGSPEGSFFEVEPSHTHYMLVRIARPLQYNLKGMGGDVYTGKFSFTSAAVLKEYLAQECGILIRDASNFATIGEGHFRIATQNDTQNELLLKSLEKLCM